jgi:hypothetical protein
LQTKIEETDRESRSRFGLYWVLSAIATITFLLFTFLMLMVPGVQSGEKLGMLSAAGALLAASLAVGVWKFGTTEAPIMAWPLGPVAGVFLLLELFLCAISVIQITAKMFR